jgi:hypothetical protein
MNKCAKTSCFCAVQESNDYCSQQCYEGYASQTKCTCGHTDCESVPNIADLRISKSRSMDRTVFNKKYY